MTTDTKAPSLKPCPFCGGEAEIERAGTLRQSTLYQCTSCACTLETGEEWDHGKQWNTRATPPAPTPSAGRAPNWPAFDDWEDDFARALRDAFKMERK
jgi:Lar family restriction alleviation protein